MAVLYLKGKNKGKQRGMEENKDKEKAKDIFGWLVGPHGNQPI